MRFECTNSEISSSCERYTKFLPSFYFDTAENGPFGVAPLVDDSHGGVRTEAEAVNHGRNYCLIGHLRGLALRARQVHQGIAGRSLLAVGGIDFLQLQKLLFCSLNYSKYVLSSVFFFRRTIHCNFGITSREQNNFGSLTFILRIRCT